MLENVCSLAVRIRRNQTLILARIPHKQEHCGREASHPVVPYAEAEKDGADGALALGTVFYLLELENVTTGLTSR